MCTFACISCWSINIRSSNCKGKLLPNRFGWNFEIRLRLICTTKCNPKNPNQLRRSRTLEPQSSYVTFGKINYPTRLKPKPAGIPYFSQWTNNKKSHSLTCSEQRISLLSQTVERRVMDQTCIYVYRHVYR